MNVKLWDHCGLFLKKKSLFSSVALYLISLLLEETREILRRVHLIFSFLWVVKHPNHNMPIDICSGVKWDLLLFRLILFLELVGCAPAGIGDGRLPLGREIEFVKVNESVSVVGLRVGSRSTCGASESSISVIPPPSACLSSSHWWSRPCVWRGGGGWSEVIVN